jgi:hypothetical protein
MIDGMGAHHVLQTTGPAPLIAFSLVARYRSATQIAMFILGCAIITVLATAMLKDSTNKNISDD